jgi:hypothetical protein
MTFDKKSKNLEFYCGSLLKKAYKRPNNGL